MLFCPLQAVVGKGNRLLRDQKLESVIPVSAIALYNMARTPVYGPMVMAAIAAFLVLWTGMFPCPPR